MASAPEPGPPRSSLPPFRVDEQLHGLLIKPGPYPGVSPPAPASPQILPEPAFPQHPELLSGKELPHDRHGSRANPDNRRWTAPLVFQARRGFQGVSGSFD
jgi:hypothetical protein